MPYVTKAVVFSGTSYSEIRKKAYSFYQGVVRKTKRRPYVRSVYFKKQKVFLEVFWGHLFEKNYWDQMRRMKLFACGIDVLQHSTIEPSSKENPNKKGEILHRFSGKCQSGTLFIVQVKEDKQTGQKYLISIFPMEKSE